MSKAGFGFYAAMGAVLLLVWSWMAVGIWPQRWVEWRAGWGDQGAIKYLYKQAWVEQDNDAATYWNSKMKKVQAKDLVFMLAQDRKTFQLLGQAQGISYTNPILTIIDKQ